jgi:hypothetical protein
LKWGQVLGLCAFAVTAFAQEYGGPAILSRGEAPAALATPEIDFRPYVGFYATYSSGLANVRVNNDGGLANDSSAGGALSWGISGTHSWRHVKLGLDYSGSMGHYLKTTSYDSIGQSFLMGLTQQLKRHLMMTWRNNLGITSRAHGGHGLESTLPFDPASTYAPTTDFFDNRTMYVSSQLDLIYQKSARLSFDFGGDGFITRRRSQALYGVLGGAARADMEYRWSRQTTIGIQWSYTHYDFTKIFGGTDFYGAALNFNKRLSKQVEFSMYGGVYRVESKFLQQVPIDPVIAQLLGISTATRVDHSINFLPNAGVRLSETLAKGVIYISGGRAVTPGNGLFLTSIATSVQGGYGYNGIRRWTIGLEGNYSDADSIGNIRGKYTTTGGMVSVSRSLGKMVHLSLDWTLQQYSSSTFAKYNRLVQTAGIGIAFAPGDVPLHIW